MLIMLRLSCTVLQLGQLKTDDTIALLPPYVPRRADWACPIAFSLCDLGNTAVYLADFYLLVSARSSFPFSQIGH